MRRQEVLHHINLPKRILTHLFGKDHPKWSRLLLGGAIMYLAGFIPESVFALKGLYGLIHATGAVPWIEQMIEVAEQPHKCENCPA